MIKPGDILRLIKKHILLLILIPAALGTAVAFLTHNTYESKTVLYTGMTSGTNVQIDQSFNLFTTNASFDNLINIIQSRETSQEVAIRLLAQHLMMKGPDPRYLSEKSFTELSLRIPPDVRKLVAKPGEPVHGTRADTLTPLGPAAADSTFSFTDLSDSNPLHMQPPFINQSAYERTVNNLLRYMTRNDTNFVYRLVNGSDPHYSIKAVSSVNVQRIGSSDLISLKYTSDDPGICQQTLVLVTEACMKNYRNTKETRSDAVVKYFEFKTRQAYERLTNAESKLQQFNQEHNIVDYKDQSKAAAGAKASLATEIQNKRIKLIGIESTVSDLQEKLNSQQKAQLTSTDLIDKRNKLAEINSRIATAESAGTVEPVAKEELEDLKEQARRLNEDIGSAVNELYNINSAAQGVTGGALLNAYLASVKELQETKSSITLLESRLRASQREYDEYEPAGVDLKRIEREISISEQEYLEMLRGLNLAKLKVQDIALSSNIKAVDPPYYPLWPNTTKRMVMIAAGALFGLILVLFAILVMEYFDETLRNPQKASKILQLRPAGVFPKINGKNRNGLMPLVTNRLVEMIIQQIELHPEGKPFHAGPRTVLFFSTLSNEGKTVLLENISGKLKQQGKKVISINFSGDSLLESEIQRLDETEKKHKSRKNQTLLQPDLRNALVSLKTEVPTDEEEAGGVSIDVPGPDANAEERHVYKVDQQYYSVTNYLDLLERNPFSTNLTPDYVLIELPALLYHSYPSGLVSSSDVAVMVCRANRSWSEADQGALDTFMKLSRHQPLFVLNGVESQVVRSSIGELPKKSKGIRRKMKKAATA